MKPKLILYTLCVLATFVGSRTKAQTTFDMPPNIVLNTKADYNKYEKDVIAAAHWMENTDLDKEKDKRAIVTDFVLKWIMGSPNVAVTITPTVTKLFENNPQLMNIFMAGYACNILETGADNPFNATKAGLSAIMTVYSKGITIVKDKNLDKLTALSNDTDMETYMIDKLKIAKN